MSGSQVYTAHVVMMAKNLLQVACLLVVCVSRIPRKSLKGFIL